MAEAKDDIAGGEKRQASDINQTAKNANDAGGFRDDKNAGGTINGGTLPVPVYQNTSDNEFYACDANDTTKLKFVGFAISNSTDGNPIDLQLSGIVRGFSGLDEGELYYVQDAVGTIGKTPGTVVVLVGRAVSTTELLIIKETTHTNGTTTKNCSDASGTQNIAHGLGRIPKKIKITASAIQSVAAGIPLISFAVYNRKTQSSQSIYFYNTGGGNAYVSDSSFSLNASGNGIFKQVGVITCDETNIIITWTKTGTPVGTYQILWEAEA